MSGGSYDHFWLKLSEFNSDLKYGPEREEELNLSENRKELLAHLEKLVPVLKALEWSDSGDSSEESFNEAFSEVFKKND